MGGVSRRDEGGLEERVGSEDPLPGFAGPPRELRPGPPPLLRSTSPNAHSRSLGEGILTPFAGGGNVSRSYRQPTSDNREPLPQLVEIGEE